MDIVHFKISGKFGHFLRAETNVSMPSYPAPPRTVILGLLGAVLGLEKDSPQNLLEPAFISVHGKLPISFWVTNKFRQSLPAPLPFIVKKNVKGSSSEGKNPKLLTQQWLFNPEYDVWVSLSDKFQRELSQRLKERRWHFTPYLGITEHLADLIWLSDTRAELLNQDEHLINSFCPLDCGKLNVVDILNKALAVQFIRMPHIVSPERIFNHRDYFFEQNGRPVPIYTDQAYRVDDKTIVFM